MWQGRGQSPGENSLGGRNQENHVYRREPNCLWSLPHTAPIGYCTQSQNTKKTCFCQSSALHMFCLHFTLYEAQGIYTLSETPWENHKDTQLCLWSNLAKCSHGNLTFFKEKPEVEVDEKKFISDLVWFVFFNINQSYSIYGSIFTHQLALKLPPTSVCKKKVTVEMHIHTILFSCGLWVNQLNIQ